MRQANYHNLYTLRILLINYKVVGGHANNRMYNGKNLSQPGVVCSNFWGDFINLGFKVGPIWLVNWRSAL